MALALATAATLAVGCLDDGGGPQDQWMNTDAYVGPEVGTTGGDGGVTCGDAPSFGTPTRLSEDREPDGGPVHVQYGVTMAGAGGDAGAGAVNVAWIDRNLSATQNADLRAVSVPAGASTGTSIGVQRPAECDLLLDPALAVTATGTVVLAATCVLGSETSPTRARVFVFRSLDGLETFEDPVVAADCLADTQQCDSPAVTATAEAVYLAWTDWTIDQGTVTGVRARVWRSDDDGVTLAEEAALPDTFVASSRPRLAVHPVDHGVHLAFTGAFTLTGTTYAAYARLDTATSFATPEVLGPGSDPRLAASKDGVYVVWTAGSATLEEAHDTGSGFSPALPVSQPTGTTSILSPSVAADPDGNVHLFWLAQSDAGWSAYYSVTKDLGAGWSEALLISGPFHGDVSGTEPPSHQIGLVDLVADEGGVTLGWGDTAVTDLYTGVTNVYLARRVCP